MVIVVILPVVEPAKPVLLPPESAQLVQPMITPNVELVIGVMAQILPVRQ